MDSRLIFMLVAAFLAAASLAILAGLLFADRDRRLKSRLEGLTGNGEGSTGRPATNTVSRAVRSTLPKVGKHLMPETAEEQSRLKARLVAAGLYQPQALSLFLGVKMLLIVAPALLGLAAGLMGLLPTSYGLLFGACASIGGMLGPSLWLDKKKGKRQSAIRRSMPDALDLMNVCMDGGLSLPAALSRVTSELTTAHPILAFELNLVQREVQFGHAIGDALRNFGVRADLDDLRNLAAAVKNAEKFGASMTKTLRTFSESLRLKRQQLAEEMAQKAGTKILFPTLIFIFPAIFLIILGPAAVQLADVFGK